jgi:hypothetical protein
MATRIFHRGALFFAVAGAPLAWAAQEWIGWLFAAAPCEPYSSVRGLAPHEGTVLTLVHLAAIAVGVLALLSAIAAWRRTRTDASPATLPVDQFLASAGIVISAVGLVALAWASLGTWFLPACEAMR